MVDIASLSIEINTRDVARAESALDDLARAGGRAESAANDVRDSMRSAGDSAGRAGAAAASASAGLDRASAAARQQADIMRRAGLSAGQYQQAMRMLPMQLTDVAVSVASGMPIWMVAIQQGGQIRDSFGGMGNAARAVVGAIGPMNLALAGAAATLGTLLIAYQQGQNEAKAYQQALALTGNAAGTSSDQLANMAQAMDEMGGTQRQAASALAEVAATGKFTADQIQLVAQSAIDMERVTGKAVSDTVKEFIKLADEPSSAAAKLNEQYNFLTASVYEQIRALEEQGRTTEAAKLATETYAAAVQQRAAQVEGSLGLLERGWNSLARGAAEAWDAMLDVGRPDTLEEQLTSVEERIRNARSRTGLQASRVDTAGLEQKRTELQLSIQQRDAEAEWQGVLARTNQESIASQQLLNSALDRTKSNAEKLRDRYKEIDDQVKAAAATGFSYSNAQIQQLRDAAAKQFKDPDSKKPKAFTDDAATRMLQQLREQEASLQAQLESTVTLSTAQRAQVEWARQLADLKGKAILTAEQKSLLANQDAITAQHAKNAALDEERRRREEIAKLAERAAEVERSVSSSLASQREQYGRQLSVFGMGRDARERVQSEASIRQQYQRLQERLNEDMGPGQFDTDQYRRASANIRNGLDEALAANADYYSQLEGMQGDWRIGASRAFDDYLADARDVSAQTEGLFTSAFSSMEDAVVEFAMTGKLSFADFTKSILADMARIAARQASSSILSGLGGLASSALGGLFSGGAAGSSIADYTSVDLSNFRPQAKGGAWIDGVQAFAKGGAFTNSVISSPTLFPIATGAGLMGEAGPEAIMPLGRSSDGSLGVRMVGGGGGGQAAGISVVINIQSDGSVNAETNSQASKQFGAEIGRYVEQRYRQLLSRDLRADGAIGRHLSGRN